MFLGESIKSIPLTKNGIICYMAERIISNMKKSCNHQELQLNADELTCSKLGNNKVYTYTVREDSGKFLTLICVRNIKGEEKFLSAQW